MRPHYFRCLIGRHVPVPPPRGRSAKGIEALLPPVGYPGLAIVNPRCRYCGRFCKR